MAKGLQEILGGRNMTGVIRTVASGLPNYLDPALMSVTRQVIGNKSTYIKVQGERSNAKIIQYGAPAVRVNRRPLAETGVTLMHSFEEQGHDPLMLQNLMGLNGEPAQNLAISEVDRQSKEFKKRLENAVLSSVYSTLRWGKIFIDVDGNILFDSNNAAVTVDFGVPANNQNQLNGIIAAPWSTATTDIPTQINAIKKVAVQTTGRDLDTMYYGANITSYLSQNNFIKDLISRTPVLAEKLYTTGEIPDGFMGLKWRPAYRSFGLNSAGSVTEWWGGDIIVAHPMVSSEWWSFQEGSMLVPRNIGQVYSDAVAAARDMDVVYGVFGYGVIDHNPPTLTQYAGHTWMPILASPADLYIMDVTP